MSPQLYTIPIPLGLGSTLEFNFDVEEIDVHVRLVDLDDRLIAEVNLPPQVRPIADAFLASWLFEPDTTHVGEYRPQAWVDGDMWQETFGPRLKDLAFCGQALEEAGAYGTA